MSSNKKKTRERKIIYVIMYLVITVLLIYTFLPKVILYGNKVVTINYSDKYTDPGYKATFLNKDITNKLIIDKRLSTKELGTYKITYYLKYKFIKISKTRFIRVVDTIPPVINTKSTELSICPNDSVKEITYTAIDEYDGNLTDKVNANYEEEKITLSVKDDSENETILTVNITKEDTKAPEITLKGDSTVYLRLGSNYQEPGYTSTDNCDGDLTDKVEVTNNIEKKVGTYKVTYKVTDNVGNTTEKERTVKVIANYLYNSGKAENGTIYLTFDDGPANGTTNVILDILKEEGVKATFFVTCRGPDSLIKRMYDEGHTVGLHTASHDYATVYASVDSYFNDLNKVSTRVKNITGIESKIIRFPGGSSNSVSRNYSKGIMTTLTALVLDRGYRYFDWNVDARDASSARSSRDVYYNVINGLNPNRPNVVLMHDIKGMTRDALRDIITYGKSMGYKFKAIDMDTYMVRHSVNN